MRHQDVVDASQLGVDLEAQVGEGLRRRLHYVLHLHTLGCHAEESIPHPLHLSCRHTDVTQTSSFVSLKERKLNLNFLP